LLPGNSLRKGRNCNSRLYLDELFAEEIRKTCEKHPEYQEDGGSWLNYPIFGDELNFTMFRSGFAPEEFNTGIEVNYPVYYGFDKNGEICQLLLEFIDVDILGRS